MLSFAVSAQGVDDVKLVVSGESATKSDATTAALRSAIEQAYGVFVSANTEILNDELVKDEIVTVSSGNVKSYKELGCVMTDDSTGYIVSLEAVVSVKQLTKYAESKGASCEFAGAVFGQSVKLLELNRKNTKVALDHLMTQLEAVAPFIFDYSITTGQPYLKGDLVNLDFYVEVNYNPNLYTFYSILTSTLASLNVESVMAGAEIYEFSIFGESYNLYYPFPERRLSEMIGYAFFNYEVYDNNGICYTDYVDFYSAYDSTELSWRKVEALYNKALRYGYRGYDILCESDIDDKYNYYTWYARWVVKGAAMAAYKERGGDLGYRTYEDYFYKYLNVYFRFCPENKLVKDLEKEYCEFPLYTMSCLSTKGEIDELKYKYEKSNAGVLLKRVGYFMNIPVESISKISNFEIKRRTDNPLEYSDIEFYLNNPRYKRLAGMEKITKDLIRFHNREDLE